jgi:succinate-semialdehyde dehydrogenase/glutarate-semialdehyde dehydrogenase
MMQSINPATDEVMAEFATHSAAEVDAALERAAAAFAGWRETAFAERAACLRQAATTLRANRDRYARMMVTEMGKPIAQALAEADKCAWVCEYYAEQGAAFLSPEDAPTDASVRSYVRFDPLGVVLAIMPWNFPFWQVFRFAAPALMAGNVGVLKHASNVPQCALAIEEIFTDAGAPPGVFTTLLVPGSQTGRIVEHPLVAAVTLTGSEPAGEAVARAAGGVLKKTVLELGGSDPYIVLADADLAQAAAVACTARTINTGQSCIAAKRFIVVDAVAAEFEELFRGHLEALTVGDPLAPETDIGPLARPDLVDDLDRQVQASIAQGARLVTGGARLDRPGAYYAPTLLADVTPGMPAFDEETFGPVAALIRAADADDALRLANLSTYGLGGSLWTSDTALGEALARRLETGSVFVNGLVKSDPRLPFGGIKRSGYGRELAQFGIREFVNIKTVWVS